MQRALKELLSETWKHAPLSNMLSKGEKVVWPNRKGSLVEVNRHIPEKITSKSQEKRRAEGLHLELTSPKKRTRIKPVSVSKVKNLAEGH